MVFLVQELCRNVDVCMSDCLQLASSYLTSASSCCCCLESSISCWPSRWCTVTQNQLVLCVAAGNFPIGQTSSGTPTSLQFVGPPGHDATILSLLLAAEELFGSFPAPPNPSICAGCVSNVTVQEVRSLLPKCCTPK